MSALEIERYETHTEALRSQGLPLAAYSCPACAEQLHSLVPRPDEDRDYTSMVVCPYCDGLHFRVTCDDGSVYIRDEPGEPLREVTHA